MPLGTAGSKHEDQRAVWSLPPGPLAAPRGRYAHSGPVAAGNAALMETCHLYRKR